MIYILTGDINTGKSTALMKWIKGRPDVFGVLSPRDDKNHRYFLNVKTHEAFAMETTSKDEDSIIVGPYHFLKTAFKKANSIIEEAAKQQTSGFIIIDELGKLELKTEGLHKSAVSAINRTKYEAQLHTILVVRTPLIETILKHYNITNSQRLLIEELSSV
ncbi:NTPase [Formosa sp. Hel1_31_208]|uniref:nucleoside-triphosphatase n=1 Tax=Formosa sp. Hel1_31_208 TaxID=1798225 RepID=UPI000879C472|nr:nucleoside-triphosphatase [Formosa sp. Hel1_31_208]SDS08008.1 NTPase [Formosa sp. Hel1_31_208]